MIGAVAVAMLAAPMALLIPASSAAEPGRANADWKLQAGKNFQRAGEYTVRFSNKRLQDAIDAYGTPSNCRVAGTNNHVVATWANRGIRIEAWTYGGMPSDEDGCISPDLIYVSQIRLTDKHWVTSRGLRVGDPTTKLRRLYPSSPYYDHAWGRNSYFLVWRHERCIWACSALDTKYGVDNAQLTAQVRAGRVIAFWLPVFGQGE
jgi:hypothetical protein